MRFFTFYQPKHRKQGRPEERALADILERVGLAHVTHPCRDTWPAQPATAPGVDAQHIKIGA